MTADTNFSFGFNTAGVQKWADGGYNVADIGSIFDGFFISDHVEFDESIPVVDPFGNPVDGFGVIANDAAEVTFTSEIIAGASVGVPGLVEAGVEGGIRGTLEFDLADVPNPLLIPEPGHGADTEKVYDGVLTADEVGLRLNQGAACLFDTAGQVAAFLDAFFWVGVDLGIFGRQTLFEARRNFVTEVLAEFSFGCADPSADITLPIVDLDVNGDGIVESNVLELQYTPGPGQPNDPERGEKYRVTQRDGILVVTSRGNADTFDVSEVGTIYVTGTPNNDEYIFGPNVTANLYIDGPAATT